MGEEEEGKDPGFRIEDKRRFTEAGEPRDPEAESQAESESRSETELPRHADAGPEPVAATGDEPHPDDAEAVGEITFSGFVNGFAIQALMGLGLMPDAASGVIRKNVAEARAMIDILGMLREKTAGNLTEEEDRMMEEMLYDLRMQYVREIRGETGTEGDQ